MFSKTYAAGMNFKLRHYHGLGMFGFFERLLKPTAPPPEILPPVIDVPRSLARFYWYFIGQSPGLLVALFAAGLAVALFDSMIPVFIGRVTAIVAAAKPAELFAKDGWQLAGMAGVVLLVRPLAVFAQNLVTNQTIAPGMTNMIRWQNHFQVIRQSWGFFQNDFAGRIANRVMQTGPALRQSVVTGTNAVWYIIVYGSTAILLLARVDLWLAAPIVLWFICYACLMRFIIPLMRERSRAVSEERSNVTGRVVDSYTNILTVKLFARAEDEDAFVRSSIDDHTAAFQRQMRLATIWSITLTLMNAAMFTGTAAVAVLAWRAGEVPLATVATALPLAWQIVNMSGWVAQSIGDIFENVGIVQDGMRSIAVPRQMADPKSVLPLHFIAGEIKFEDVYFDYGRVRREGARGGETGGVLRGLDLHIGAGERVGLIGRSGAGKSTLVNLLLKFHLAKSGRILLDGQDIADVEQESLRAHIGMVTQDTSLLHRSIRENLAYGRPDASEQEIVAAAAKAHALDFIEELEDWQGRRGFDAHVGERGVKLSGGQRQRIAIARVILKDAPILVLDEATSALDSEVEAAIQEQLDELMQGRTVIAIAHRLSTIARMDRLAVIDQGRIIEAGSHAALLAQGGVYASLWLRQSGGFLTEEIGIF
jgi:ATP-binding cassette subfamily B multidrug efflux pump